MKSGLISSRAGAANIPRPKPMVPCSVAPTATTRIASARSMEVKSVFVEFLALVHFQPPLHHRYHQPQDGRDREAGQDHLGQRRNVRREPNDSLSAAYGYP